MVDILFFNGVQPFILCFSCSRIYLAMENNKNVKICPCKRIKYIYTEKTREIEVIQEMNELEEKKIMNEINEILDETTKFDVPFWMNREKKEVIIAEKKSYVEERIRTIAPEYFPDENVLKKIWFSSIEYTEQQFELLAEKYKINGFYLQELLHCYAKKIENEIMDKVKEK